MRHGSVASDGPLVALGWPAGAEDVALRLSVLPLFLLLRSTAVRTGHRACHPRFTANVVLERDKRVYVMQFFVPVLLVPFVRPIGLLLIVAGSVFSCFRPGIGRFTNFLFSIRRTGQPSSSSASSSSASAWARWNSAHDGSFGVRGDRAIIVAKRGQ
ncbi:MAG: hypothetical protein M3O46_06120 [Myxococcota bacterium]|nr:hypothetical protein [Myxococcota bacterium]